MGLSLRVIAPRGGFNKLGGGGISVYHFFKGFFFSTFFKFQILKSFNKKYSIAQYCAIYVLDLEPHLFCGKNLYYVKNLITIKIQTVSSLNIVTKFAPTVQGLTTGVV